MFTGIIEECGTVRAIALAGDGARIEISAVHVLDDVAIGASISVNGCCLTVVAFEPGAPGGVPGWWAADVVTESLERTSLGSLSVGDPVNLERPVRATDRLGGHIVQGHVDAVGLLRDREAMPDDSVRMTFTAPDSVLRYVVEKGSITVDGISLTVAALEPDAFAVAVIPHTLAVTTLGTKGVGDPVNLEVDVVAKYVERLVPGASRA
jgi:riboflavin synthase